MSPSIPVTSVIEVIRRTPSRIRLIWTIMSTAELICIRTAWIGSWKPAMATMFSSRVSASRGRLAWIVDIEPSWPVFIACSMSNTSPPRTSPRMIRSGRMRRAFLTRSRMVTSPLPSRLEVRVSIRRT